MADTVRGVATRVLGEVMVDCSSLIVFVDSMRDFLDRRFCHLIDKVWRFIQEEDEFFSV